ncbi:hypothetical protein L5515_015807 [Caenorhabditis briggsae]|uniref:C3H1-type domain-containing protein n=2 Tax=Caenorhabditis briggsae TaxID=6238 RepID=A0AAE9EFW9_CAEBR|nr:hypothetical protein L5515_015807 [Caenorhabditis briggsae]
MFALVNTSFLRMYDTMKSLCCCPQFLGWIKAASELWQGGFLAVFFFVVEKFKDKKARGLQNPPLYPLRLWKEMPKRKQRHFAHKPKKLKRAAQSPPKDPRWKTMICRNLGDCPFGGRCQFLHKEDGPVYLKAVDIEKKKDAHSKKVQALHTLLKKLHPEGSQKALDVEEEINKTVREYNETKPRGDHYYDLHGMTRNGAEAYIEEIVVEMKKSLVKRASIETGCGKHSKWNIPTIKDLLIAKNSNDIRISCDQWNPGILILTIL